ncbi:MAG: lipopolysaccharide heptosyltransferase I [Sulfuricella sp.]|nr:lipopolysaccharide heptosyltransferase I [Sulfuricella sp.]
MLKILLVKTSSMGDVIHNLPVVSDLLFHFPDAEIDWVVEESFAGIPALHPGVREIIPVAIRRWRKNLFSRAVHTEIGTFVHRLRSKVYDVVLDTQGLIKSAAITRLAHGARCGFDRYSAREPLSALLYDKTMRVEKSQHAVARNRLLAGRAFGYIPDNPVDYGIAAPALDFSWLPAGPFAVLLHATSRDDKLWPEDHWKTLGAYLADREIACVLPWGNVTEQQRSQRLAARIPNAVVTPALTLGQAAALLSQAVAAVGVDTGLIHLAAALKVPVAALYCASEPGLTGVYTSSKAINLGGAGSPPDPASVISALTDLVKLSISTQMPPLTPTLSPEGRGSKHEGRLF